MVILLIIILILIGFGWYFYQNRNTADSDGSLKKQLINIQVSFRSVKSSNKLSVDLVNGKYDYQSPECSPSPCSFELKLNTSQFKDINNDGKSDALVTSSNWTGGNKSLQAVEVFINTNGTLKHIGSIFIGTSPTYNSLQAENNIITINYDTTYNGAIGWSDPKTFQYKVENNTIVQLQ
jgi:hypothetical protein